MTRNLVTSMALLPHDLDAERALLSCAMLDPASIAEANLHPEQFYHPHNRAAWTAAQMLADASQPVDPITISDRCDTLSADYQAELRGTLVAALAENHIPSAVRNHADVVRRLWVTRQIAVIAGEITEAIKQGERGTELAAEAMAKLGAIQGEQVDTAMSVFELAVRRAKDLASMRANLHGYTTGVAKLDDILGGLQPGIVTVAAGRPGMGKSAFAMGVTQANAERGVGVHVFSLEDTAAAYADRILSRFSRVDLERFRTGKAFKTSGDWSNVKAAINGLNERRLPWIVDDRSGIDAIEIVRGVRRRMRDNGTRVVVVDYVNLLKRPVGKAMHEHLNDEMQVFADAAKRDDMAYLVLSQLSRRVEQREDKVPILSDLRDSGGIEEKAKAVVMLYRPYVYDEREPEHHIELHVRKNNQGPEGYVEATWHGPTTTIS